MLPARLLAALNPSASLTLLIVRTTARLPPGGSHRVSRHPAYHAGLTGIQLSDTGLSTTAHSRAETSQDQNNPVVPTTQTLPTQEPGSRPHT